MSPCLHDDRYELREARDPAEVAAAQALRYRVFVEEGGALADAAGRSLRRDIDRFDAHCDHLIVIDHAATGRDRPAVVGTYRLLRQEVARAAGGFYSASEFDLACLLGGQGRLLELGRSCVAPEHRGGHVLQLLWRGLASYVATHGIDLMFGCASLPGTRPDAHAHALAWLHHRHLAPTHCRPTARGERVAMDLLPTDAVDEALARRQLPPLLKGYLLAGAVVGEGAVIDRAFNTIDVCVLLPTARLRQRNLRRFQRPAAPALRVAA